MEAADAPFEVLLLDNHLLAVAKPPGLLVQGDQTGDADLVSLAKAYLKKRFDKPGNVFVGLVHRLDRPTSGVVLLARTSKAAGRLSEQFRRRTVEKRYLAVVEGRLEGGGEQVDGIQKEGGGVRVVPAGASGAQRAALRWRALAASGGRTLVEVELLTGRKHQIRAQLAARGAPVLGDFRYGSATPFADGRGIALHAWRLAVEHPTRREPVVLSAFRRPPPGAAFSMRPSRRLPRRKRRRDRRMVRRPVGRGVSTADRGRLGSGRRLSGLELPHGRPSGLAPCPARRAACPTDAPSTDAPIHRPHAPVPRSTPSRSASPAPSSRRRSPRPTTTRSRSTRSSPRATRKPGATP